MSRNRLPDNQNKPFPLADDMIGRLKKHGDADFVALDLTCETQVLLEKFPTKATVHFKVTAYNPAMESAASAVVDLSLA